jgi:ribA/ribD-fused uncharacterized protein
MANLFFQNEGRYTIAIKPEELSNSITDILKMKLTREIEGICVNDGYIKKNSIKIISKSMGKLLISTFEGDIVYTIKYSAQICNPPINSIIMAKVKSINKMGVIAESSQDDETPLNILLAVQHHIERLESEAGVSEKINEDFKRLQENDVIYVKIAGKRFEYGDSQISVIGKLVDKPDDIDDSFTIESEGSSESVAVKKEILNYNVTSKKYNWLSNFYQGESFMFDKREYPTIEHAFQAQKNNDDDFKDLFTKTSNTYVGDNPKSIKKIVTQSNMKKINKKIVDNWEETRLELLESIMRVYYQYNDTLKKKLLDTDNKELVFKGAGADTFYGIDKNGDGENKHGRLLMKLRDEFKG